jgi:hypothetical protein
VLECTCAELAHLQRGRRELLTIEFNEVTNLVDLAKRSSLSCIVLNNTTVVTVVLFPSSMGGPFLRPAASAFVLGGVPIERSFPPTEPLLLQLLLHAALPAIHESMMERM